MKEKEKHSSKSILFQIVTTALLLIFIQFLLVVGAIFISRVAPQLEDNAYEIFSQTVENRKDYIDSEIYNRWSAIDNYVELFGELYPDKGASLTEPEALNYFENVSAALIEMLRNSSTTGAFIILNDGSGNNAHSSFFITDGDPTHNNLQNNSDILLLKGPLELTKSLKIPLHIQWNYGITLEEETKSIYEEAYNAADLIGENKHMGYWDIIPSMYTPNAKAITYTKPLVDKNGYVFGVAGVEIAQDYFYQMLPATELAGGEGGGYAIIKEDGNGNFIPLMERGAQMEKSLPYGEIIPMTLENERFGGYSFDADGMKFSVCYRQIALYNKNTPFESTKWYLMGVRPERGLTENSGRLKTVIFIALIISLITGTVIAILTAIFITRSTSTIVRRIREFTPGRKLVLGTTGISEINELAQVVEQLNDKILNYALKTDKIISMVNVDIGSYEYDISGNRVKLSPALANMLGVYADSDGDITAEEFDRIISEIKNNKSDIENIYKYCEEPPKWMKLESVETDTAEFGIVVDVTKDELTRKAITYERDHDTLTGIYNRFAFKKQFEAIFDGKSFQYGAFVMGDLDNLKHINDIYGHDFGDKYIIKTAQTIASFLEGKAAVYGRMSGDEFYMFHYGSDVEEIRKLIYELHLAFNRESIELPDGSIFKLKMSCGISWYPKDTMEKEELIRYADFAMYQGKHSVKGGIREFEINSYNENSYMFTGKEELYTILEEQLCEYVFQPIYDVRNISTYGYEALMRPYGKNINSPDRLLHLAQVQGLLYKVEHNTFYMVLELCKKYASILMDKKVFINSVPNQILGDDEYKELEHIYGEFLKNIVIEITENETINDLVLAYKKELVGKWKAKLALDDYGSGYANDLSIIHLHPDIVKIDRMLIDGVDADKQKQSIIRKTISFARENGIHALAEGVETKEQLAVLLEMGIDFVQGYYISRPSPLPDFDDSHIAEIISEIKNNKQN